MSAQMFEVSLLGVTVVRLETDAWSTVKQPKQRKHVPTNHRPSQRSITVRCCPPAVMLMQESPSHKQLALRSMMQLTLHATRRTPHGASRLVQPMSAWWGRSVPALKGCEGLRVSSYGSGHAWHEYTPPSWLVQCRPTSRNS